MTPAPLQKKYRDPATGEIIPAISVDGGKTWRRELTSDGAAPFDVPANLGVTDGPVPKVPARPSRPVARDPTDFDPNKLGAASPPSDMIAEAERKLQEDAARQPPPAEIAPRPPAWIEAIGRSLGQGLTGRFADEFGAVAATRGLPTNVGMPDLAATGLSPLEPEAMRKPPGVDPDMDAQRGLMREAEEQLARDREAYPKSTMAAEMAGAGVALSPLAAFGLPATAAGRMGAGALGAGAEGFVSGMGGAEMGQDMLAEGGTEAAIAAPLGGVAGALPVDKVAQGIGDWASRKRLTSTGIGAGDYNKLVSQGAPGKVAPGDLDAAVRKSTTGPEAMGEAMEDVGLTGGITTRGYWKQAERMRLEAGQEIERIVDDIASVPQPAPGKPTPAGSPRAVTVDFTAIASKLDEAATEMSALPMPEAERAAADLAERAQMLNVAGFGDYKTAWKTRVMLDELAFDAEGVGQKNTPLAKRLRSLAGDLQEQIEAAVERDRPELLEPLRDANKRYSAASKVSRFSGQAQGARETGDPSVGEVGLARSAPGAAGVLAGVRSVGDRAGAFAGRGVQQGLSAFAPLMGYAGAQMLPEDLLLEED